MPIQLYASNHDDSDGALRAATTGLSLSPKNPFAYNNLALALFFRGEPKWGNLAFDSGDQPESKTSRFRVIAEYGSCIFHAW